MAREAIQKDDRAADDPTTRQPIGRHIEAICHDVNSALATVVLCIDSMADCPNTGEAPAVEDARIAVRRIAGEMSTLRKLLELTRIDDTRSGVFKCAPSPSESPCSVGPEGQR